MQSKTQNLLVIDLETSGTNPFKHDVLAVGMTPFSRDAEPLSVYVRPPETPVWTDHARANFDRFAEEWERFSVSPEEACSRIEAYIRDVFGGEQATPVGHNVGFDQAFLRKLAFQGGREAIAGLSHRAVDTHTLLFMQLLRGGLPAAALSSDGAFLEFGINVPAAQRHTAVGDALATRELVTRLFAKDALAAP